MWDRVEVAVHALADPFSDEIKYVLTKCGEYHIADRVIVHCICFPPNH